MKIDTCLLCWQTSRKNNGSLYREIVSQRIQILHGTVMAAECIAEFRFRLENWERSRPVKVAKQMSYE